MKKSIALYAVLLTLNTSFAQVQNVAHLSDAEILAVEFEKEAELVKHDKETKRLLKKVGSAFKHAGKNVVVEFKKLDDCQNCEDKKKGEIIIRNIGRGLGKGSAWVTTTTTKPFLQAAGFLTGLIEKKEKNQDIVALYRFFLKNSSEFDKLYLEAGTPEELLELVLIKVEELVERKSHIILKDLLVSLGITREIPADISEFELSDEEIDSIDFDKVSADFINNHAEYADLKPILGPITQEQLTDIITSGYFENTISFDNYKAALPKIHEGVTALVGQIAGPQIVLNLISKSLAGIYSVPVLAADVGTAISAGICLQQKTKDKFEKDADLRKFCSYVINRSSYQLLKGRARGFVAGKNLRSNIEKKIQERKERRAKRKAEKKS